MEVAGKVRRVESDKDSGFSQNVDVGAGAQAAILEPGEESAIGEFLETRQRRFLPYDHEQSCQPRPHFSRLGFCEGE